MVGCATMGRVYTGEADPATLTFSELSEIKQFQGALFSGLLAVLTENARPWRTHLSTHFRAKKIPSRDCPPHTTGQMSEHCVSERQRSRAVHRLFFVAREYSNLLQVSHWKTNDGPFFRRIMG